MTSFLQYLLVGLTVGSIYSLVAVGIVLIYKSSGVFNFAQGEFLLISAYLCWTFMVPLQLPVWVAFLITFLCAALMGLMVERFCLRPMIGQPILAMIMVTLALTVFLRGGVLLGWGGYFEAYPTIFSIEPIAYGGIVVTQEYLWAFVASMLIIVALVLFTKFTKAGLRMRAAAEDQQVARSMGVSVKTVFAMSWAIAGVVAVVGGFFLGNITGISLHLSALGMKALPVVLLGGLESIPGAVVAGLIVGILEAMAAGYIDPLVGGGFAETLPFIVLIIVIIIRPHGLFGLERIERV